MTLGTSSGVALQLHRDIRTTHLVRHRIDIPLIPKGLEGAWYRQEDAPICATPSVVRSWYGMIGTVVTLFVRSTTPLFIWLATDMQHNNLALGRSSQRQLVRRHLCD